MDRSSECHCRALRVIKYGSKTCGGPWRLQKPLLAVGFTSFSFAGQTTSRWNRTTQRRVNKDSGASVRSLPDKGAAERGM